MKLQTLFENSNKDTFGYYTFNDSIVGSDLDLMSEWINAKHKEGKFIDVQLRAYPSTSISKSGSLISKKLDALTKCFSAYYTEVLNTTFSESSEGFAVFLTNADDPKQHVMNNQFDWKLLPTEIDSDLAFTRFANVKDLKGIDKHFKKINGSVYFYQAPERNMLGLLKIKGIKDISFGNGSHKLENIFNKHFGTDDLFACQDELIDNGFIEQAKI